MSEQKVTLYHCTLTKSVPNIRKKGILPMQRSNWVVSGTGERYGGGEIFAFEKHIDAVTWAMRWDWQISNDLGSGKISIVTFYADPADWEVDDSDPLTQFSYRGKWLKSRRRVPPSDIEGAEKVTQATIDAARKQNPRAQNPDDPYDKSWVPKRRAPLKREHETELESYDTEIKPLEDAALRARAKKSLEEGNALKRAITAKYESPLAKYAPRAAVTRFRVEVPDNRVFVYGYDPLLRFGEGAFFCDLYQRFSDNDEPKKLVDIGWKLEDIGNNEVLSVIEDYDLSEYIPFEHLANLQRGKPFDRTDNPRSENPRPRNQVFRVSADYGDRYIEITVAVVDGYRVGYLSKDGSGNVWPLSTSTIGRGKIHGTYRFYALNSDGTPDTSLYAENFSAGGDNPKWTINGAENFNDSRFSRHTTRKSALSALVAIKASGRADNPRSENPRSENPRPRNQVFTVLPYSKDPNYYLENSDQAELAKEEVTVATLDGVKVAYTTKSNARSRSLRGHREHTTPSEAGVLYRVNADGTPDLSVAVFAGERRGEWQIGDFRHNYTSDYYPSRREALQRLYDYDDISDRTPNMGNRRANPEVSVELSPSARFEITKAFLEHEYTDVIERGYAIGYLRHLLYDTQKPETAEISQNRRMEIAKTVKAESENDD
jgi:hypothetical protein